MSSCLTCAPGTFFNQSTTVFNASMCVPCPANSYSPANATTCTASPGYYLAPSLVAAYASSGVIPGVAAGNFLVFNRNPAVAVYGLTGAVTVSTAKANITVSQGAFVFSTNGVPLLSNGTGILAPYVWYQFDQGACLFDSSGGGYNLTSSGGALCNATFTSNKVTVPLSAIRGTQSAFFTSSSSSCFTVPIMPMASVQQATGITIAFWGNMNSGTTGFGRYFDFSGDRGGCAFDPIVAWTRYISQGYTYMSVGSGSSGTALQYALDVGNAWHHYALAIAPSGAWWLWLDGQLYICPTNCSGGAVNASMNNKVYNYTVYRYYLGRTINSCSADFMDGGMDDFRMYPTVLTTAQVYELYSGKIEVYAPSLASPAVPCSGACANGTLRCLPSGYALCCGVNTYFVEGVSTACAACAPSTVASGATTACAYCAAGTYFGGSTCVACAAGLYGNGTGCAACGAGSYGNTTGLSACQMCAAGLYGNATGLTACQMCAAGLYGNSTGLTVCSACPAGYYETGLGSTGCTGCAGGSYDTGLGMPAPSNCVLCGVGTYSTSPDAPTMMDCTSCPAGTYGSGSGSNASAACVGCAPGLFASGTGFSSCAMCAAGLYGNASALSACQACAAGSVTNASGLSSCSVCAPGTLALATTCWACAPGTYSTVSGAVLVTPYVAPPPAPTLHRNGSQLPVGVGQYCTYYVPGPAAISDVCYLEEIENVDGIESPCDNPLLYNYTLCTVSYFTIDNVQAYICDIFQFPACPWPFEFGCELIGNAVVQSDSCDSPSYPGFNYATNLVCEEGCAAVAPCTNGADGVYLGAGFTTANSCPVQCNPGYILNPVTNACACAGGACVEGLSPCLQCPVGSYQTASGATTCAACAAGTFSESTGAYNATECAPCPAGYYCASGALLPCPTFTSSPGGAGAVTQCQCAGGYACAAFVNVSLALYYAGNFTNYTGLRAALQTALGGASVFFS
jgi:hypothetical protein